MNDGEKALAAADAILAEHGIDPSRMTPELLRSVVALAYMKGARDELASFAAKSDAALARLADDLRAVTP